MFVGRTGELRQLGEAFSREHSATLLYGKRRVGKTTLIKQALEAQQKPCVYFECLKGTMRDNIDGLTQELIKDAGCLRIPQHPPPAIHHRH